MVNGKEHFKFMHHNVLAKDINDGKMEFVKFRKVGLNDRVSPSHSNILQRAHQWAHFHMKKNSSISLAWTLFHMCKSGQFYPNPTQLILLRSMGMNVGGRL